MSNPKKTTKVEPKAPEPEVLAPASPAPEASAPEPVAPKVPEPEMPVSMIGEFEEDGRKFRRTIRNADGDFQIEYLD